MKCTNCQYENDPSARFCSQCGMPLNRCAGCTRRSADHAQERSARLGSDRALAIRAASARIGNARRAAHCRTANRAAPQSAGGRRQAGRRYAPRCCAAPRPAGGGGVQRRFRRICAGGRRHPRYETDSVRLRRLPILRILLLRMWMLHAL